MHEKINRITTAVNLAMLPDSFFREYNRRFDTIKILKNNITTATINGFLSMFSVLSSNIKIEYDTKNNALAGVGNPKKSFV